MTQDQTERQAADTGRSEGQQAFDLVAGSAAYWIGIDQLAATRFAWGLYEAIMQSGGGSDGITYDLELDVLPVLRLAWQEPACKDWMLTQQTWEPDSGRYWMKDRRDTFARLMEQETKSGETRSKGMTLATFKDAPEPEPVLWRDADGRHADPVLSVGEVALLSGAGGLGKSYLTLAVAVAGALAADLGQDYGAACGIRVAPGPVVMVSYEDSPARTYGRLRRMQQTSAADGIHVFPHPLPLWVASGSNRGASMAADWWADLWQYVREVQARLLVIDPASAALADTDVSQTGPVRQFLRALTFEAEPADCGVLIVAHSTKAARTAAQAGEDPGAGVVAGSAAWYDGARGVLTLEPHKDVRNLRVLSCVKANYGRTGWGCILHEVEIDGGGFAGLDVEATLADVGGWRKDEQGSARRAADATQSTTKPPARQRNGKTPDDATSFDYGDNVYKPGEVAP